MEKIQFFQQMVMEQLDIYMQKYKSRCRPYIFFTKIIQKWITKLNAKHKAIKLLKDNVGKNLGDPGSGDDFLDMTPKSRSMTEKKKQKKTDVRVH